MTQSHDNLVLFDGVCNFCNASVQFVVRHDRQGVLRFASLQSDLGREVCRRLGLDPASAQTFLVLSQGKALVRSEAALEVAGHFGGAWKLLALLRVVPRPLRDRAYSLVARNRYRWFGRTDSCMIPAPELRARFLS